MNLLTCKIISKAYVIYPEARGVKRICNLLSRWHTSPPEAHFLVTLTCGEGFASVGPAGSQPFALFYKDGFAKHAFIVTVTDQRSVTVTNLGSRGFISWPGVSI